MIIIVTWCFTKEVGSLKLKSLQNITLGFSLGTKEFSLKEVPACMKILEANCIPSKCNKIKASKSAWKSPPEKENTKSFLNNKEMIQEFKVTCSY